MSKFFFHRIINSKSLYFILFVTIAIAFLQIFQEATYLTNYMNDLSYNYGVLSTPYQSWIEINIGSYYRYIIFLLLPIIVAIPMADLYAKDQQTGYLKSILSKGKMKEYFRGLYISNFIVAGVVIATPLLVNLYLAFMTLPNVKPDPIVSTHTLDAIATLFPGLYYEYPMIHTFFYILLASIYAGMYATVCLSISLFIRNRFVILVSAFVINMGMSLVFEFMGKYGWLPSSFLTQQAGQLFPVLSVVILIFSVGMVASTMLYMLGVKKRVID